MRLIKNKIFLILLILNNCTISNINNNIINVKSFIVNENAQSKEIATKNALNKISNQITSSIIDFNKNNNLSNIFDNIDINNNYNITIYNYEIQHNETNDKKFVSIKITPKVLIQNLIQNNQILEKVITTEGQQLKSSNFIEYKKILQLQLENYKKIYINNQVLNHLLGKKDNSISVINHIYDINLNIKNLINRSTFYLNGDRDMIQIITNLLYNKNITSKVNINNSTNNIDFVINIKSSNMKHTNSINKFQNQANIAVVLKTIDGIIISENQFEIIGTSNISTLLAEKDLKYNIEMHLNNYFDEILSNKL